MTLLDRYIGKAVLSGTMQVLAVLLALFAFAELVAELDYIGKGQYGFFQALQYISLSIPRLAYQFLPLAALIGSLLGLGMMASNSELVVMRAAGISVGRIVLAGLKTAMLLVVVGVGLGELVIADSEQLGQDIRSNALAGHGALHTEEGFWTRDGDKFINVRAVLPNGRLIGVSIYEFDNVEGLHHISTAKNASYKDGEWRLQSVASTEIQQNQVVVTRLPEQVWQSQLNPELLDVIAIKPSRMSSWYLYQYIGYLHDNGLDARRYEIELWTKIAMPFATCVMVILAVPFVFGSLRSVGVGQRILVGSLMGIGFYIANQILKYLGIVYEFNPIASALLPTVVFFVLAMVLMRRVH